MAGAEFLPDEEMKPWCPHILWGTSKPKAYSWTYGTGWFIEGCKGGRTTRVPKTWLYCPLCSIKRPHATKCSRCGQMITRIFLHRIK